MLGKVTSMVLSRRPGLRIASSSYSGKLVEPKTITFDFVLNPSISTNN